MSAWNPNAVRPYFESDPLDEFTLRVAPQFEAYVGPRPCARGVVVPQQYRPPQEAVARPSGGPANPQSILLEETDSLARQERRAADREFNRGDSLSRSRANERLAMHVAIAAGLLSVAYVAMAK